MYLTAELVDCDKLDDGCNGGFPSNAYHEIQRLGQSVQHDECRNLMNT